jgi:hypothetical protein
MLGLLVGHGGMRGKREIWSRELGLDKVYLSEIIPTQLPPSGTNLSKHLVHPTKYTEISVSNYKSKGLVWL